MNCYYSNLIEGHNTVPRDIERALAQDYSSNPQKRNLQLEAVAHIAVQERIDRGLDNRAAPASMEYLRWLHESFCGALPPEWLRVEDPETGEQVSVIPGEIRQRSVSIGTHVPPYGKQLERMPGRLRRGLSKASQQITENHLCCRCTSSAAVDSSFSGRQWEGGSPDGARRAQAFGSGQQFVVSVPRFGPECRRVQGAVNGRE